MVEPIFDFQFRLILIGDSTVGKSSLLKYFTDGRFAEVCWVLPNWFVKFNKKKHEEQMVNDSNNDSIMISKCLWSDEIVK